LAPRNHPQVTVYICVAVHCRELAAHTGWAQVQSGRPEQGFFAHW
jgi:hypothetical protein